MYDVDGRAYRVVGAISNISEIKQSQAQLEAAQTRLLDSLATINEGYLLLDAEQRVVMWNPRYVEIFDAALDVSIEPLLWPGRPFADTLRDGYDNGLFGEHPEGVGAWVKEFIRFLNAIQATVPADKAVHVVLDNYAAHKHPKVRAWLARHERFTFHFVHTSCSWLNAVEGFFAKLSKRRLKRGVFHSVVELQAAINRFVSQYNKDGPKPFTWTADPDKIIATVKRGHQALDSNH